MKLSLPSIRARSSSKANSPHLNRICQILTPRSISPHSAVGQEILPSLSRRPSSYQRCSSYSNSPYERPQRLTRHYRVDPSKKSVDRGSKSQCCYKNSTALVYHFISSEVWGVMPGLPSHSISMPHLLFRIPHDSLILLCGVLLILGGIDYDLFLLTKAQNLRR